MLAGGAQTMSPRAWSDLVVLPERAGGDCRLVGCARLDTDDAQWVAMQCIRPAGHEGPCRRVAMRDLELAERLTLASLAPGHLAWALLDDRMGRVLHIDVTYSPPTARPDGQIAESRLRARGLLR